VFYIYIVKVDRDVAHVAMTIHLCFKGMFQISYMFQTYVASVSFECSKVDLDVAYIYASVLGVLVRILQVFQLDVLHMFA
jgi:hypothetical protein